MVAGPNPAEGSNFALFRTLSWNLDKKSLRNSYNALVVKALTAYRDIRLCIIWNRSLQQCLRWEATVQVDFTIIFRRSYSFLVKVFCGLRCIERFRSKYLFYFLYVVKNNLIAKNHSTYGKNWRRPSKNGGLYQISGIFYKWTNNQKAVFLSNQ